MGDGPDPVWPIEDRAQNFNLPLNERRGARAEIGPPRTPEERHSELGWRDEHGRSRSWGDEPDVQERERDTGKCVDEMEAREHDKDGLLALPASPYPWNPSIKDGRRRGSQE